jgi:Domain of unknown function (DUF4334)/GXWXG protein
MSVESDLLGIIHSGKACPAATLMPLFERLEPISAEFMIGTWRGGKFDGGADPDPINWYGKRFASASHVEPLLCRKEDGSIYSYDNLGLAQLREVAFGGKVSASLIYDKQPIMDYFRKVTKDIVIGLGDIKGRPTDFFFHLTRE